MTIFSKAPRGYQVQVGVVSKFKETIRWALHALEHPHMGIPGNASVMAASSTVPVAILRSSSRVKSALQTLVDVPANTELTMERGCGKDACNCMRNGTV